MTMNFWEFALFCAAAYVAIVTLVRVMRRKRDDLLDELAQEAEAEQQRLRAEEQMEKRRQKQEEEELEEEEKEQQQEPESDSRRAA